HEIITSYSVLLQRVQLALLRFVYALVERSPLISALFPYTTLFRSNTLPNRLWRCQCECRGGSQDCTHNRARHCETRNRPRRSHRSEEHTSELQSRGHLVCRLLLEKKNKTTPIQTTYRTSLSPTLHS